jgi:hypothetical protein
MSRLFRRRGTMPPELIAALQLGPGERVLAWSSLVGGGVAAATITGLRIFTPRGRLISRPWVGVDHAAWDQDSAMLVVWWVDSRQTTPLEILDDVGRLPEVIRERVQASVVLTSSVVLPGGRMARVALRRDARGLLSAQSLLPPGAKADDPQVAPVLKRAIDALWAEAGEHGLNSTEPPSLR